MASGAKAAAAMIIVALAQAPLGERRATRWTEPRTGMSFVRLPPGEFAMGSPETEPWREAQERQHKVAIAQRLFMGTHEVTQEQWEAVMGTRPSWFDGRSPRLPVENVTWIEVQDFLRRLTSLSDDGSTFRLPTEAEWEYACRAGTTTAYHVGAALSADQANIDPRTPGDADPASRDSGTRPVGSYRPNRWGLFDMHGNVWEWTSDPHCPYPEGPVTGPIPGCGSPLKVIRGGSWRFRADSARCALRYTHAPDLRGYSIGFRVVREQSGTAR
jgi:formylglycine-generating enzyme required for sulfatase activity